MRLTLLLGTPTGWKCCTTRCPQRTIPEIKGRVALADTACAPTASLLYLSNARVGASILANKVRHCCTTQSTGKTQYQTNTTVWFCAYRRTTLWRWRRRAVKTGRSVPGRKDRYPHFGQAWRPTNSQQLDNTAVPKSVAMQR